MPSRVRVFCATSLDGFLAGEGDDLSWLPPPGPDGADGGFGAFLAEVGALLMGRRTYDVVAGFEGPWPYGDRPVLVATHRPLAPARPGVHVVEGRIEALVQRARAEADGGDVYVDGGELIRAALDAGLVDEVVLTVVPAVLGRGVPLFAGSAARHRLSLVSSSVLHAGMVQLVYRPERA
jgi:dihydrofolate reductase